MDEGDAMIEATWESERPYLLRVARRVLGGRVAADGADDVVQEAYGRLAAAERATISDVRGWLTVVVRNIAIDRVRSAAVRHESSATNELASTAATGADPADRVTLDDQVQRVLAVVLDRLSPAERTAFVLHDVFGFAFDEVGQIVGRSAAACRQLASRARRSIHADAPGRTTSTTPMPTASRAGTSLVTQRFIAVCEGGDITELMAVLDPDVVGLASIIDRRPFVEIVGRDAVSARVMQLFGQRVDVRLVALEIESCDGIVVLDPGGRVRAVLVLESTEGLVHHIESFVKLARSTA